MPVVSQSKRFNFDQSSSSFVNLPLQIQIVWPVCGALILAATPLVYRMMRVEAVSGPPAAVVD